MVRKQPRLQVPGACIFSLRLVRTRALVNQTFTAYLRGTETLAGFHWDLSNRLVHAMPVTSSDMLCTPGIWTHLTRPHIL